MKRPPFERGPCRTSPLRILLLLKPDLPGNHELLGIENSARDVVGFDETTVQRPDRRIGSVGRTAGSRVVFADRVFGSPDLFRQTAVK